MYEWGLGTLESTSETSTPSSLDDESSNSTDNEKEDDGDDIF